MDKNVTTKPEMQHVTLHKPKKPWYKRFWVWLGILVLLSIVSSLFAQKSSPTTTPAVATPTTTATPAPAPTSPKWDVNAIYDQLATGMSKSQVEATTGKTSDNCSKTDMGQYGTTESCSYGNPFVDKGTISVIYTNDALSSKTKSSY